MEKERKPVKEKEELEMAEVELVPDLSEEMALAEALPGMNITSPPPKEEPCIVSDDAILGLYDEILANCREDRKQVGELLGTFVDMVVNDGEASSSTKEAVVNLAKAKTDINDKMAKVADLMTRIKLKDKDTFPRYLAAHQHNNVTIEANSSKREVLKALQKKQKEGGK